MRSSRSPLPAVSPLGVRRKKEGSFLQLVIVPICLHTQQQRVWNVPETKSKDGCLQILALVVASAWNALLPLVLPKASSLQSGPRSSRLTLERKLRRAGTVTPGHPQRQRFSGAV